MLFNNVQTKFLVEESDFLPVSGQSGLNFKVRLMHFLMKGGVTLLNYLCTASTNRFMEQMFINTDQSLI